MLLLADVFKNFRRTCLDQYSLDPANYYTSLSLSWDALLKHRGVKLELLTNTNIRLLVEKGLRGGIGMVSKRLSKANNPMVPDFDPGKSKTWIQYYDANDLYGWAISQPLPTGGLGWIDPDTACQALHQSANAEKVYVLEVDLEYQPEQHNAHNGCPLAPERVKVHKTWMLDYQQRLLQEMYGVHLMRSESWCLTCATSLAMFSTAGICSFTCSSACV